MKDTRITLPVRSLYSNKETTAEFLITTCKTNGKEVKIAVLIGELEAEDTFMCPCDKGGFDRRGIHYHTPCPRCWDRLKGVRAKRETFFRNKLGVKHVFTDGASAVSFIESLRKGSEAVP